jgi:hypothetical protein
MPEPDYPTFDVPLVRNAATNNQSRPGSTYTEYRAVAADGSDPSNILAARGAARTAARSRAAWAVAAGARDKTPYRIQSRTVTVTEWSDDE